MMQGISAGVLAAAIFVQGSTVPVLRDPSPRECITYSGSARRFRIPRLEDMEVFGVQDSKGDGRTFSLETARGQEVAPAGSPGSWGELMTVRKGWTEWVGVDGGFYLTLSTATKGRVRFSYCITRVD